MTTYDEQRSAVAGHVQTALGQDGDDAGIVTEFVLIAVRIDEHGDKSLSVWTPPDQRMWTTQGLMSFATQSQQAQLVARMTGP